MAKILVAVLILLSPLFNEATLIEDEEETGTTVLTVESRFCIGVTIICTSPFVDETPLLLEVVDNCLTLGDLGLTRGDP